MQQPVTEDEISRGEKNGEDRYFLCNLYLSCFPRYCVSTYEMLMRFRRWDIAALTRMSLYCRRATGSDADRDRGADTVVELSIGVPHHFVHILGVNENSANDRRSRYVLSVYANAFSRASAQETWSRDNRSLYGTQKDSVNGLDKGCSVGTWRIHD